MTTIKTWCPQCEKYWTKAWTKERLLREFTQAVVAGKRDRKAAISARSVSEAAVHAMDAMERIYVSTTTQPVSRRSRLWCWLCAWWPIWSRP